MLTQGGLDPQTGLSSYWLTSNNPSFSSALYTMVFLTVSHFFMCSYLDLTFDVPSPNLGQSTTLIERLAHFHDHVELDAHPCPVGRAV